MKENIKTVTAAFEFWESDYRNSPQDFMTHEECLALEIADISEKRAVYFMACIRHVTEGGAA